jgi:hypothetical protein
VSLIEFINIKNLKYMSQHPQYKNSPEKNLEELYQLLSTLEWFGLIHEEIHQPINSLMSNLYPVATKKYTRVANGLPIDMDDAEENDDEEEFEDNSIPFAGELWEYLDESEKEQFIQDFRNVIDLCIHENGYALADDWEALDRLNEMRDLDYYRMHVHITDDIVTQKKYKDIERTVWFPSELKPARVGVYEVAKRSYLDPIFEGYASWNGKGWSSTKALLKDAITDSKKPNEHRDWIAYCWRGFTEQVK